MFCHTFASDILTHTDANAKVKGKPEVQALPRLKYSNTVLYDGEEQNNSTN